VKGRLPKVAEERIRREGGARKNLLATSKENATDGAPVKEHKAQREGREGGEESWVKRLREMARGKKEGKGHCSRKRGTPKNT